MKEKLIKILNLAESPNDNEAITALRMATRLMKKNNETWESLLFNQSNFHQTNYNTNTTYQKTYTKTPDIVFKFGKHKGKTIEEVYCEAPDYLDWIIDTFDDDSFMKKKVQEFLHNQW